MLGTRLEQPQFLDNALAWLRWMILVALFIVTAAWPIPGRTGHPLWVFIALFVGYNLAITYLRTRSSRLRSFAWTPLPDLLAAALIYFLDSEPSGPLFVIFYVAVITAALHMTLLGTLAYITTVIISVVLIAPTLPLWSPGPAEYRALGTRVIVLAFVGIGTGLLTRRLVQEQETARLMRDAAERHAELDRLREEFLASVSHELRTPLTSARAGLGMLESKLAAELRPDEQRLLGNVRRNIERLGILIDDLLTYNQIRAGALLLDREPLDLRAVMLDALTVLHPLIDTKQQTLTIDVPEPLPYVGDARRLEQVVINLAANAHRHTPSGTQITIAGRIKLDSIHVLVSDTGPGIPRAEHEAIFDRFHRLGTAEGSSGLGLAIARGIVELHGGQIWVESQPGAGAIFHVALPCRPDSSDAQP